MRGRGVSDAPELVTVTVDDREMQAEKGALLIQVAQDHGIYIPRFCWHERMKPVGMCRMCLVEVEGMRGLPPACTTTVTDGMVAHTETEAVRKVQDGMLELLLINHPLDCPVCDRGGECPLQDQTLSFGPGESRFVEEKRHWEKPIPISPLVLLDRERCIQCARCTRFAEEIAGDPLIDFGDRSMYTEVIAFPDEPFASYFSGNTVQICPVGALTAKPYRFTARPWDLASVETSCTVCAVHCRGALQSSSNRLVRLLGVDSDAVNHGWLCDKGRFGYEAVHAQSRVLRPGVRREGRLVECSWPEALDAAADGLRRVLELHGPQAIAVLGGARGTNEDAYVWARLAKGVLRTDHVDAQMGDGLPADVLLGLPAGTIPDLDRAAAIVLLGPDLKEELPVLFLRVKRAAQDLGVPLVDVSPGPHGLTRYAHAVLRPVPGGQGETVRKLANAIGGATTGDQAVDGAARLLQGRDGEVVVVLGRGNLAEAPDATVQAAAALAATGRARFLGALHRGNVRGALDLGLAPGLLPGRVTLDAGREWFTSHWGGVPDAPGLDALGILRAAGEGRVHALVLLGADPVGDCPDRALAERAVAGAGFVIALDTVLTRSNQRADVFLPVTTWGEERGSASNVEGRVQRLARTVTPDGTPMADWRIAVELAARLGTHLDLEQPEEVQDAVARVAPAFAGVDAALLRRARDGIVLPLAEHRDDLVLDRMTIPVTDASWEPIASGVVGAVAAEETHRSSLGTGVVEATGTGATTTIKPGLGAPGPAATAAVDEAVAAATRTAVDEPPLHRWTPVPSSGPVPPRDAYALRLVTGRTLYDDGVTVACSPSLSVLERQPIARVSPRERGRLGVDDGAAVRLVTGHGSITVPVVADATVPEGVVLLPFNVGDPGAADLIDAEQPVTDVRVETLG